MPRNERESFTAGGAKMGKTGVKPMKKFASRPEELVEWMKSFGYQLPKNVQPEHFEYIFQNEDTARIVKEMMKAVKPQNILSHEEISKFEKMKEEGRMLYGADLEVHFDRIKAIKVEQAKKEAATIQKDLELDRLIAEKEREIARWKAIDKSLDSSLLDAQRGEAAAKNREELEKIESEKLDKQIASKQQELIRLSNILQEKLKSLHASLSSETQSKKSTRLCDNTWLRLLEEEEKLSSTVKSMFDKYGTEKDLIGSESGLLDPNFTQAAYRLFKQQENHLERLKHEIVYEKVREIEMDIEMAGTQKVLKGLGEIVQEAKRLYQSDPEIRDRMVQDLQETCETFDTILRREQSVLFDSVRQDTSCRLNSQIKEIIDLKSSAKKKKEDLMQFLVNTLVSQRVRIDVVRELFRAEKVKNEKFNWYLQDYRNAMFDLAKQEETLQRELTGITTVDSEIVRALEKYKIPLQAYHNPLTTYQTLGLLKSLEERDAFNSLTEGRQISHLTQQVDQLQGIVMNIKLKKLAKTPLEESIFKLQSKHRDMENKLEHHVRNKEKIAKENVEKIMGQITEVADFLNSLDFSTVNGEGSPAEEK